MGKIKFIRIAIAMALLVALRGNASNHSKTEEYPKGYQEERPGVVYGAYNTVVQALARVYQERILEIENLAYGLAKLSNTDPIKQAEKIYLLENAVVNINLDVASAPDDVMTAFEKRSLLAHTGRVYTVIRTHAERIFEDMIRYIDEKLPGSTGKQNRSESGELASTLTSTYEANYRLDNTLTPAERDANYQRFVAEFQKKGGSLTEIKTLTPALLKSFGHYTRVEYVWLIDGKIRVTPGSAGHVLLAEGKPVKAAGQIVFLKGDDGKVSLLVISNSSGNYKPDMLSIEQLASSMQKTFGIPGELVVVTKGEPMSAQAVKIYLKGRGIDPVAIKAKMAEIEVKAEATRNPGAFATVSCGLVFSH